MNFVMIGLLLREALDRLRVRLNMYLVKLTADSKLKSHYSIHSCCHHMLAPQLGTWETFF